MENTATCPYTYYFRKRVQNRPVHYLFPKKRSEISEKAFDPEELKGESAETVADGGIGLKTLPDAGEENNRTEIGKISFDADQGRLQERVGGFHLAVSLYT
jgi:hypothetical protein